MLEATQEELAAVKEREKKHLIKVCGQAVSNLEAMHVAVTARALADLAWWQWHGVPCCATKVRLSLRNDVSSRGAVHGAPE